MFKSHQYCGLCCCMRCKQRKPNKVNLFCCFLFDYIRSIECVKLYSCYVFTRINYLNWTPQILEIFRSCDLPMPGPFSLTGSNMPWVQWRKSRWGGGRPPPPLPGKLAKFRKFWPKSGLKTVFSSANAGVCRKFESFVGSLGDFAPPGKSEFPPLPGYEVA
jgi:hypothetical protein